MPINRHFKKIVAFFLIGIVLTFSSTGFCQDFHATASSCQAACKIKNSASLCDTPIDKSPASPADEHSSDDHGNSNCYCACHLPLTCSTIAISYLPHMSVLTVFMPFKAFPEIYLDKFIPPQNLA